LNWGFEPKQTEPGLAPSIQIVEHIVDLIFMIDFILRFFVARKNKQGILITSRKVLWKQYIKRHFIVDFVTCVPLDKVVAYSMGYGGFSVEDQVAMKSLPIVQWFVRFRVFRGYRVYEIFKIIDDMDHTRTTWFFYSSNTHYMRLILLIFGIVIFTHFASAVWYATGYVGEDEGWNWQQRRELCGVVYEDQGLAKKVLLDPSTPSWFFNHTTQVYPGYSLDELWTPERCVYEGSEFDEVDMRYLISMLASMLLLLTGENLQPILETEKVTQILYLFAGVVITASVYGNVHSLVHNIMARTSAYQRKMEIVYDGMDRLKLPKGLQERIFFYYEYLFKEHGTLDGSLIGFVPEISQKLQAEIYLWQRFNLVHSVPFFKNISPVVLQEIVMKMGVEVFLPGDYIVNLGDYGDCMYFIYIGQCEVLIPLSNEEIEVREKGISEEEEKKKNARRRSSLGNSAAQLGEMLRRGSGAGENSRQGPRNSMKNFDGTNVKIVDEPIVDESLGAAMKRSFTASKRKSLGLARASKQKQQPVKTKSYKVVATLNAGQYFGEVAVVLHSKRTASIRSKACCEVCVLTNEVYNTVAEQYPKDAHYMKSIILSKYSSVLSNNDISVASTENKGAAQDKKDRSEESDDEASDRKVSNTSTVPSTPQTVSRNNSSLSMQGPDSPLTQLKQTTNGFMADVDLLRLKIDEIYQEELRTCETISSIQRRLLKIAATLVE
jgi:CRP-like cAMP-binding protein